MSTLGRRIGIALLLVVALVLGIAAVTAVRLRQESRPLAAYGPLPDAPTRHVDLARADENLRITALPEAELAGRGITKHGLGELELATGAIVAADPVVQPERPAFARTVPPGRYAVTTYKAQQRIAMAELRFAPGTPTRWQMALVPGQDAGTLKDGEIFGYPVDAGLGCFMDVEGRAAFLKREQQEKDRRGERFVSSYDDIVQAPLDANGGTELMLTPLPEERANVAIIQSGWGDGFYASYWGLDDAGMPLVLVTDFGVLENGDGRAPPETPRATP